MMRLAYVCFALTLAVALQLSLAEAQRSINPFPLWGLFAFWAWYLWFCPFYIARKVMKSSPGVQLPRMLNISEEGLYSRTSASESRMAWEVFVGWAEAERVFVLLPNAVSFFPVPKRAMTDDQQRELRDLLRAKLTRTKS
jgi:hypothetical protein